MRELGPGNDRGTILLIDPDQACRSAMGALLSELGFDVLEAFDGAGGLRALRGRSPSMIVSEVWPFLSPELASVARLRRGMDASHIPFLVLTSAISPELRRRAIAAGCEGYLEKPCAPDCLIAAIRETLSRSSRISRRLGRSDLASPA